MTELYQHKFFSAIFPLCSGVVVSTSVKGARGPGVQIPAELTFDYSKFLDFIFKNSLLRFFSIMKHQQNFFYICKTPKSKFSSSSKPNIFCLSGDRIYAGIASY